MKRLVFVLILAAGRALAQQAPADPQKLKTEEQLLQRQLELLRMKYTDSHPTVVEAKAKLEKLREAEGSAANFGLDPNLPDRWWRGVVAAQALGLSTDQQKKMDDVFQQYRLKLIDLNAALEKEEITIEPLVAAEPLDEAKIAAQIDRVAQARAELEKANGRMLLGIRKLLTPEQWRKLNQMSPGSVRYNQR